MRKRQTFLLTVLTPENCNASFCGRLKVIASGKTFTFTTLEELYQLIASEMGEDALQHFMQNEITHRHNDPSLGLP